MADLVLERAALEMCAALVLDGDPDAALPALEDALAVRLGLQPRRTSLNDLYSALGQAEREQIPTIIGGVREAGKGSVGKAPAIVPTPPQRAKTLCRCTQAGECEQHDHTITEHESEPERLAHCHPHAHWHEG